MRKTNYKILGGDFYINGIKTYTDIEGSDAVMRRFMGFCLIQDLSRESLMM